MLNEPYGLIIKIFANDNTMRQVTNPQYKLGEIPVHKIKINLKSRDDIPSLLLGLQHIYTTPELCNKVFTIQEGKIPHKEKVFLIFEEYTEWISKGKAGVPVELRLKMSVLEDQHGFILHHHVMQHETDDQIAISMVGQAQNNFPSLNACSFNKGFHSPANQKGLR